jgi:UDP-2-acetamido-3-amino-2,3-dideoxy-glucuronate N-acetyltransferase
MHYFKHESAYVDEGAEIGDGTKIWHFSHVQKGAKIGECCVIGQNVNVDGGTVIGNNVKIQNNVSVYTGIVIEDDVFLGPSCVLTNVTNPRSQVSRHSLYEKTLIRRGATLGANCTIVCGVTLGRYCFIAAGSVVTKDVPDYALMVGNPARQKGWMSRHGHILRPEAADSSKVLKCESSKVDAGESSKIDEPMNPSPSIVPTLELQNSRTLELSTPLLICPESGYRYVIKQVTSCTLELRCIDLDEEAPLPAELTKGSKTYDEFKV